MGSVTLGTSSCDPVANSYTRLYEPGNPSQPVDLAMFKLQPTPTDPSGNPLSGVNVSSSEPDLGTNSQVVAIGYGLDRAPKETYWDSQWNVVIESGGWWLLGLLLGEQVFQDGGGPMISRFLRRRSTTSTGRRLWATIFDANGNNNEMQAATGDSGDGVLYKHGDGWELLGIMLAVDVGSNLDQPDGGLNMAVFGDTTYMADLSVYYGEITK